MREPVEHFTRKRDRNRRRARRTRNPVSRAMYRWCADRCETQRKEALLRRAMRAPGARAWGTSKPIDWLR